MEIKPTKYYIKLIIFYGQNCIYQNDKVNRKSLYIIFIFKKLFLSLLQYSFDTFLSKKQTFCEYVLEIFTKYIE